MRVQELYETALAIIGKTEEGTDYDFMNRVPYLLNSPIHTLNLFRDSDNQIAEVKTIADTIELTAQEAQGLSLCLACVAASEIDGFPENRLAAIYRERAMVMGGVSTGMTDIPELISAL